MATVKELRAKAKAQKIPKYYKMSKSQLLSALGMSEEPRKAKAKSAKREQIVRELREELDKLGDDLTEEEQRQVAKKVLARHAKKLEKPPSGLAELDPSEIEADPKRFQYKLLGEHTKTGEVGSLSGVQKYDPDLAGIVQVWHDPADGKTYVVNGHNRLALAKRLGAEKVAVRYLDVPDAKTARATGALTNIAESKGDALDAAKFFRDSGISREDLQRKGIPMREKIAQDGLALSKLDDSLFRKTIDGELSIGRAAIIGGSGLDHAQQRDLVKLVDKQGKRKQ